MELLQLAKPRHNGPVTQSKQILRSSLNKPSVAAGFPKPGRAAPSVWALITQAPTECWEACFTQQSMLCKRSEGERGTFPIPFPTSRNISRGVAPFWLQISTSYLQLSPIPATFERKHPLVLHFPAQSESPVRLFLFFFRSWVLSQLCAVTNKAGCGSTGLCRGPEAQRQIEMGNGGSRRWISPNCSWSVWLAASVCVWEKDDDRQQINGQHLLQRLQDEGLVSPNTHTHTHSGLLPLFSSKTLDSWLLAAHIRGQDEGEGPLKPEQHFHYIFRSRKTGR